MTKYLVRYTDCRTRTVVIEADNKLQVDEKMMDVEFFSQLDETHIVTTISETLSQVTRIAQIRSL